jgi:hypothetical protein
VATAGVVVLALLVTRPAAPTPIPIPVERLEAGHDAPVWPQCFPPYGGRTYGWLPFRAASVQHTIMSPPQQLHICQPIQPNRFACCGAAVVSCREPRSILSQPQAEQQVQLLNRAYTSGLPGLAGVISEDAASAGPHQLWRFKLMGVRYVSSKNPMCIGSQLEDKLKSVWHPQLVEATRQAGGRAGAVADKTLIIYTTDLTSPACKGLVPGYVQLPSGPVAHPLPHGVYASIACMCTLCFFNVDTPFSGLAGSCPIKVRVCWPCRDNILQPR